MSLGETFFLTLLTSVSVSGILTYILQEFWQSKVRSIEATKTRNRVLCDDFSDHLKNCRENGVGFWAKDGKSISTELKMKVVFTQAMAENKFHLMEQIGYNNRDRFLDLVDLMTGDDFDENTRPASKQVCNELNEIISDLCRTVDTFKFDLA